MHTIKRLLEINLIITDLLNSNDCSMMFLNVNICSLQEHPCLKPACSFLSFLSISDCNLFNIIQQTIFIAKLSGVIPLQLSQLLSDPFLGIFTITPFDHSDGVVPVFHMRIQISLNFSITI